MSAFDSALTSGNSASGNRARVLRTEQGLESYSFELLSRFVLCLAALPFELDDMEMIAKMTSRVIPSRNPHPPKRILCRCHRSNQVDISTPLQLQP